jgi:hypothetical protein
MKTADRGAQSDVSGGDGDAQAGICGNPGAEREAVNADAADSREAPVLECCFCPSPEMAGRFGCPIQRARRSAQGQ